MEEYLDNLSRTWDGRNYFPLITCLSIISILIIDRKNRLTWYSKYGHVALLMIQ